MTVKEKFLKPIKNNTNIATANKLIKKILAALGKSLKAIIKVYYTHFQFARIMAIIVPAEIR